MYNLNDLDAEERAEISRQILFTMVKIKVLVEYDGYGRNVCSGRLGPYSISNSKIDSYNYKTCPKCGRTILKNRSLCDCGYDFILNSAPNFGSKSRKKLQKEISDE